MGWQGGKHLAETAMFTYEFCHALLSAWMESRPEVIEISDSDSAISQESQDEAMGCD